MPTISDVARAAGVGIGTVSRVINDSPLVSKRTRQRVLQAIAQLGYHPSPTARAFGRRRTQRLEVLIPRLAAPFGMDVLRGIEDALQDTDYGLLLRGMDGTAERDRVFETCCRRGRADGVLVVWTPPTEALVERLAAQEIPAVLINALDRRLSSVAVDHEAAARDAVAYCVGLGHRRVALLDRCADPFAAAGPGICRSGYDEALSGAGIDVRAEYVHTTEPDPARGAQAVDALLSLAEPPTAIVAGSDAQAIGALQRARWRQQRVPEDVSIVSYNENSVSAFLGLTTLRLPLREMGRRATELLLVELDKGSAGPHHVELPTELVVRATCGPPPR